MTDRFGDTPEKKANAHTRTEQHRKPGTGAKFRLCIFAAYSDFPINTEGQVQTKDKEYIDTEYIQPAATGSYCVLNACKSILCTFLIDERHHNAQNQDERRGPKYRAFYRKPE